LAKQLGTTVQNELIQGLVTEATGLNFPEKAVTQTENCKFLRTGEVIRRLGIEFEDNATYNSSSGSDGAISEFYWRNVGTGVGIHLVVVQRGTGIRFFQPDADGNISGNLRSFSINLMNYAVTGVSQALVEQNV